LMLRLGPPAKPPAPSLRDHLARRAAEAAAAERERAGSAA
jgi:hypothetical protein